MIQAMARRMEVHGLALGFRIVIRVREAMVADGDRLRLEEVYRFENGPVAVGGAASGVLWHGRQLGLLTVMGRAI